MTQKLSVIVHSEREPETIARCLSALAAQRLSTRELEVFVVDRRGRLGVRQLVKWWNSALAPTAPIHITYVAPRGTEAASDAFALRLCRGDIVAHLDESSIPDADWAARGVASVLERESSHARSIFGLNESFQRRENLLVAGQQIAAQVNVSTSTRPPSAGLIRPFADVIRIAPNSEASVLPRRLPSLRSYFAAFFALLAVAAFLSRDLTVASTAGPIALALLLLVTLSNRFYRSQPATATEMTSVREFRHTLRRNTQ